MKSESEATRQANRMKKEWGARLQALRKARGLSQRALADLASGPPKNLSQSEINRLEAGSAQWEITQLLALCRALRVKPWELIPEPEFEGGATLDPREDSVLRYLRDGDGERLLLSIAPFLGSRR